MWERTAEERKGTDLPKKYLETINPNAALDDSYRSLCVVRMEKRRKKCYHWHIVKADYMGIVRDVVQSVCQMYELPDEWAEIPEIAKTQRDMEESGSEWEASGDESEEI